VEFKNKIFSSLDTISREKIENWKSQGKKIVFTNGCFDILHSGHIQYLSEASKLADVFVLGLNSDASVRRLKGKNRPIKSQGCRADILAFMSVIDMVVIFDDDTPENIIMEIMPDVLVKGGDWKIEEIVGSDVVLKNGGEVKSLSFLEGHSSSIIIEKMNKS